MSKNRLQLNFQLEQAVDRAAFVQDYLKTITFEPTADELETISNYILWGKNSKGKNPQQEGSIKLKEWTTTNVESLEGLLELPGFQETSLRSIQEPAARIPRIVFNREDALNTAPDYLKSTYNSLFRKIDELELIINFYELFVGRRKTPPRESLVSRFTPEEQKLLNEKALRLSQFKYLKMRHLLVELRSEQYTYSDFHTNKVIPHNGAVTPLIEEENIYIGEDITVYPAGLKDQTNLSSILFPSNLNLSPFGLSEENLKKISDLIWRPQSKIYIDFTNEAHVLELYKLRADLEDAALEDPAALYGSALSLINTLKYYEDCANLSSLQKDILELKLKKIPNANIADQINQTYGKSYNDNYISTIFHQKIIPDVAHAAQQHREIIENLFYPENFKKCKDCGKVLLINNENFVKQKKSSDGFSPRCKQCEKLKRSKYKNDQ